MRPTVQGQQPHLKLQQCHGVLINISLLQPPVQTSAGAWWPHPDNSDLLARNHYLADSNARHNRHVGCSTTVSKQDAHHPSPRDLASKNDHPSRHGRHGFSHGGRKFHSPTTRQPFFGRWRKPFDDGA